MSEANLSKLAKIAEATLGTTPATPQLAAIPFTGESLKNNKETIESQQIRSDRQIADLVKVHTNPEGGYDFELDFSNFDHELRGALGSPAWNSLTIAAGDVATDHTAQTITGTGGLFANVVEGALIKIATAEDAGNNGLKRVISVDAAGNVMTLAAGSLTATNASDTTMAFTQNAIVNGTLKPSITLERGITNSAGDDFFQQFKGMVVDTLELTIESKAIITGSVGYIGMSRTLSDATIDTNGVYTDAVGASIMNGTNNVGSIKIDGVAATERFKRFTMSFANNLRGKDAMGTEGNFDIGTGTFTLTGALNSYFFNNTFLTKMDANTSFSLEFSVTDPDGNAYHFFMPNCKPANGDPQIEGINSDVMLELEYQAIRSSIYGCTCAINKVPA